MKWISIKDQLPGDKQTILVFNSKTQEILMATYLDKWIWAELIPDERKEIPHQFLFDRCDEESGKISFNDITHWVQLPKPPREEKSTENDEKVIKDKRIIPKENKKRSNSFSFWA